MFREFSTSNSDARDTIGSWRAAVAEMLVDVDCTLARASEFNGAFSVFSAGEFGLAKLGGSRHSAMRDRACIRRSGDDFFMLFLQQIGRMGVVIQDREFEIQPGDFFLYDAKVPHRLIFEEPFEHIAVRVPRTLVGRNWRALQHRGCFQMTPREPLGRIAAAALDASAASITRMSRDDLAIAVENVIDLFAAGAGKPFSSDELHSTAATDISFARARAVIQARLDDSELTPDDIAGELRISRRALNKLFERQGIGPMEYIILERLEQAARDLSSPSHRSASITDIAFRWGFKNTSHFAKRFRQHFGMMPSELRSH